MNGFYGQSFSVRDAENVSGAAVDYRGYNIQQHYDGTSAILSSGDSFIAGINPRYDQLQDQDVAVISWVLELGAASSGTLRLSSGLDPDYSVSDTGSATEALGVHAVTGKSQLVVTQTTIGVPILVSFDEMPIIFVECIAGAVEVVQVKLRVWPPGGPAGSWVSGPSYEMGASYSRISFITLFNNEAPQFQSAVAAWQDAQNALYGRLGSQIDAESKGVLYGSDVQVLTANWTLSGGSYWWISGSVSGSYLMWDNPGPMMNVGPGVTSYGLDPDEIPPEGMVRGPAGGSMSDPSFVRWRGVLSADAQGQMRVGVVGTQAPTLTPNAGNYLTSFELPGTFSDSPVDISTFTSDVLLLAGLPPEFFISPTDGFLAGGGGSLSGLGATMSVPAYEYYDPAAVQPPPPPPIESLPVLGAILFDTPDLAVVPNDVGVYFATT